MSTFTETHTGTGHDVRTMYDTAVRGANVTYLFCLKCGTTDHAAEAVA